MRASRKINQFVGEGATRLERITYFRRLDSIRIDLYGIDELCLSEEEEGEGREESRE